MAAEVAEDGADFKDYIFYKRTGFVAGRFPLLLPAGEEPQMTIL